jgi:hypothetical protein
MPWPVSFAPRLAVDVGDPAVDAFALCVHILTEITGFQPFQEIIFAEPKLALKEALGQALVLLSGPRFHELLLAW